jgi:hypothetical protein
MPAMVAPRNKSSDISRDADEAVASFWTAAFGNLEAMRTSVC